MTSNPSVSLGTRPDSLHASAVVHAYPVVALLWDAYRAHPSSESRNLLVECYQGLVHDILRRFTARLPRAIDRGDLATAANVGLMAAISGYDPARGVPFESYCERRVKGAVLDELRSEDWLPRPWRARIELHKRVLEELRSALNREPCDGEVAARMGMPAGEYGQIFGSPLPGAPAHGAGLKDGAEDQTVSNLDVVEDTRADSPDDQLTREELLRLVAQRLTDLEYRIVYLRYWEGLPMREIGLMVKLSESRVCKIHARLLERLKERLRA